MDAVHEESVLRIKRAYTILLAEEDLDFCLAQNGLKNKCAIETGVKKL